MSRFTKCLILTKYIRSNNNVVKLPSLNKVLYLVVSNQCKLYDGQIREIE